MPMRVNSNDMKPFEGLRGVISVVIVVGHYFSFFTPNTWPPKTDSSASSSLGPYWGWEWPHQLFSPEYLQGVTIFLLLSGIGLSRGYSRTGQLDTSKGRLIFLARRFARLAPCYFLGLALNLAPFLLNNSSTLKLISSLVMTPLFLQSWSPITASDWAGPLWTVSVFAFCYIMYSTLHRWYREASNRKLWWLASVFGLIPALAVTVPIFISPIAAVVIMLVLHSSMIRVFQFLVGAILGEAIERRRDRQQTTAQGISESLLPFATNAVSEQGMMSSSCYGTWDLCTDGLSFVMLATQVVCITLGYTTEYGSALFMHMSEYWLLPLHCLWLYAMVQSPKAATCKILCTRPAQLLGESSYALYALHFPLIRMYDWAVNGSTLRRKDIWFALEPWHVVFLVPLLVIISFFVNRYFSEPLRSKIDHCLSPKSNQVV